MGCKAAYRCVATVFVVKMSPSALIAAELGFVAGLN